MSHLVPSSSVFGGFFWNEEGFGGFAGGPFELEDRDKAGAGADPRSAGFLCVICEASTFLRPLVTEPPLLRSAKTLDMSPAAGAAAFGVGVDCGAGAEGAAGGGGGGAGAEGAAEGFGEAADRLAR